MSALTVADLNHAVNGQPRILDERLGEVLQFDRPRDIRKLVDRHRSALERFGSVCATVAQTSAKGGRPGRVYWLTKKQALYLCTKSETDRATDITIQIVEVFDAATGGHQPLKAIAPPAWVKRPTFCSDQEGLGCVVIDGVLVHFASGRRPEPNGLAVVIHQDGHLAVEPIPPQWERPYPTISSAAVFIVRPGPYPKGFTEIRDLVSLVGAVVRPSAARRKASSTLTVRQINI